MAETKDGGPAFPVPASNFSGGITWEPEGGMSLRDYFAAQVLRAACEDHAPAAAASRAYQYADAMISERAK